jgi:hypothetical protein
MTDWRTRLRDADPAAGGEIPAADLERMRATVLAAARGAGATMPRVVVPRAFVLTAGVLLMTCAGMLTGLQSAKREMTAMPAPAVSGEAGAAADAAALQVERQQLQFSTPGGTRIIWVFDSQFDVKGTLP